MRSIQTWNGFIWSEVSLQSGCVSLWSKEKCSDPFLPLESTRLRLSSCFFCLKTVFHHMSSLNSPCPTMHDFGFSVASNLADGLFAMWQFFKVASVVPQHNHACPMLSSLSPISRTAARLYLFSWGFDDVSRQPRSSAFQHVAEIGFFKNWWCSTRPCELWELGSDCGTCCPWVWCIRTYSVKFFVLSFFFEEKRVVKEVIASPLSPPNSNWHVLMLC